MQLNFGPPTPSSAQEAQRVEHAAMRRRVMYGMHKLDVEERLVNALGTTRARAVRLVDMTANPAWYVCSQLAALYRELPEVLPPDGAEETAFALLESGWWQLAARNQRDTIAFNDQLVRVDLDEETGAPSFRLVPPDLFEVDVHPLRPSQPLAVREWIPDPDDTDKWVMLSTDPRTRTYQALAADRKTDVTERVLGQPGRASFSGEAYPWVIDGQAVLPYVAYHSAVTGFGLDPYTGREVFEGALQLGVYYSFFGHALRQASWAQRWALGAEPMGGDVDEAGRRRDVVADPASVVMLRQIEDATGAQVGQWGAPVDPDRLYAAISRYEQRLVEMALSTVGVSRRESDVRSAMSLAVSREAQREAQRAYEPVFRRSDLQLLRLVAGLRGEPTEGWTIRYRSLPRDHQELDAELDRWLKQLDAGLVDRVTVYRQLHPGVEEAEAQAALARIDAINAARPAA